MRYLAAAAPLVLLLGLMIQARWGAARAGPAAWLAGLLLGAMWFGVTPQLFWVSQAKGLLLSIFVLAVMWPALFLYHWLDQEGGIAAAAHLLEDALPDRGLCALILAWAVSGLLEGIAGFGLPIAVVAPMLTALGVRPVMAVAAVAIGHSWAVTFGDMGVILQTLAAVTGLESVRLVPWAGLLLAVACLLCGLGAALLLGALRRWRLILALSLVMGGAQYGIAAAGLAPLSGFGAGLAGVFACLGVSRLQGTRGRNRALPAARPLPSERLARPAAQEGTATLEAESAVLTEPSPVVRAPDAPARPALWALGTYGALGLLMAVITLFPPVHAWAEGLAWKPRFPQVTTRGGMVTPAAPGQVFRPVSHPGTLILAVALAALGAAHARAGGGFMAARRAATATIRSAAAPSAGIISMVGLSTLMDHCGMSWLLAQGLTSLLGAGYPLVSPCVGILGAFATGSNNNSNVLFGSLQKNVAVMLGLNPELLVAAQTAGGSLGSMLAPAKIVIGCSTVGCLGDEGRVLRKTVPCGLGIGLGLGVLVLVLSRLR